MTRRFFCLILICAVCAGIFAACGKDPPVSSGTGTAPTDPAATSASHVFMEPTDAASDTEKTDVSSDTKKTVALYDGQMEHKIILYDVRTDTVKVMDLNLCEEWSDLTDPSVVIWEWNIAAAPSSLYRNINSNCDDAKIRYSPYYGRDVVLISGSHGWAGVVDYETKDVLWEKMIGNSPHSIEMLPNGDLAVACSGGAGFLEYVPLSAGITSVSGRIVAPSCHGVCWDPQRELLWVLQQDGVIGVAVENYGTAKAKPVKREGSGASFPVDSTGSARDGNGHDLSPMYGTPGKYWVSGGYGVWIFDAEKGVMNKGFPASASAYDRGNVKGIAYFADNTMVQTVAAGNTKETVAGHTTRYLDVITMRMSAGKVKVPMATRVGVKFADLEFYKVHTFTKDYQ